MYNPLPEGLMIQKSSIQGQGLVTTKFIDKDVKLGLSHIIVDGEIIRTPLGGFVNHSNKPNCIKEKEDCIYEQRTYLVTNRLIKKGEEITTKYTMYKV